MGTVVAIGGYKDHSRTEEWIDTPIQIDQEILRLTGKKKPNVLFIPTASSDAEGYIRAFLKIYRDKLGVDVDLLLLYQQPLSSDEIQTKIYAADVIYVGGGNTLKMMKKWRRLGVDQMLKAAYERGAVMCGVSAGSICWFEFGVSDSLHFYNEKETQYIKVRGLGILEGIHCPHYQSKTPDNRYRIQGMKDVMKRSKGRCLAIPDASALVIQDGAMRAIGEHPSSWCWWEGKKWCSVLTPSPQ